jgi:hypothetical protein
MARIFNEGFEFGNKGQFERANQVGFGPNNAYPTRLPGGSVATFDKGGAIVAMIEGTSEIYTRFLYFCNTWANAHHYGRRLQLANTRGQTVAVVLWGYQGQPESQHGIALQVGTPLQIKASRLVPLRDHEHRAVIEIHFRYTLQESSVASPNFEMRVNGTTVLTYTGATATAPTPPPDEPVEYEIRDVAYCAPTAGWGAVDDVAINDTRGSLDNSWCGDGVIVLLKPNGASQTQLKPSNPDKPNFELVADASSATWVESDVPGYDVYEIASPTLKPNDTIKRVWAQANARKLNIDSPGISLGLDRGSGVEWSEASKVGLNLTEVRGKEYPSVGRSAWTQDALAKLKVGVKVE